MRGAEPPAGSPNYFVALGSNLLRLWKFHVDWANPGNSTFAGPTNISVASFSSPGDIPQPSPGEMVDSLGDRLMFQLQYRNFGAHESLWVNHTVVSGGVTGVRWYELRSPGSSPFIYQQSTYQPDSSYRWMGSVAVDGQGNMAVGYSVSSNTLKPSIRYAGRLVTDPLGSLPQGENSIIEGTGVQLSGSGRWGDYSAMTIDPVDDCTFWYTQEYYEVNSNRNWQTRIGSFKFPGCGQPKIYVGNIVMKYKITVPNTYMIQAKVPVWDEAGNRVAGADVTAQWTLPDGRTFTQTRTTASNGAAAFTRTSKLTGLFTIMILDVQKAGYEYDPSMNQETSEDLMVP